MQKPLHQCVFALHAPFLAAFYPPFYAAFHPAFLTAFELAKFYEGIDQCGHGRGEDSFFLCQYMYFLVQLQ